MADEESEDEEWMQCLFCGQERVPNEGWCCRRSSAWMEAHHKPGCWWIDYHMGRRTDRPRPLPEFLSRFSPDFFPEYYQ